jgi:Zn-finger nucleic acid-binding protein
MAVVICPWCQSEITLEEGAEPEKYCPICENELDGYRTLRLGLGGSEDDEDEDDEDDEAAAVPALDEEDLSWIEEDGELQEKNEAILAFEKTVEGLLDDQDAVPECPQCREYMLDAGEHVVSTEAFRARVPAALGEPVLTAPFSLTVYICPSCFTVQQSLSEQGRNDLARRLSQAGRSNRPS